MASSGARSRAFVGCHRRPGKEEAPNACFEVIDYFIGIRSGGLVLSFELKIEVLAGRMQMGDAFIGGVCGLPQMNSVQKYGFFLVLVFVNLIYMLGFM